MGVATPWPKRAMAPPIICEKNFFNTFWRILCIELPFICFLKILPFLAFTYFCNQIFVVET